ncbi:methyltransferase domain-containing protein [Synergistaceae bacterium OttesenSCG-928-I11]|nr:methyltransferase domain-containing protein [Synergistaceae bacterium OttesenSCG-928-I11]
MPGPYGKTIAHIRELFRDPRDIGSVCPSSHFLADTMASAISPTLIRSGRFVELGAGTGPVTEALLKHGVQPERLYVVEKSEALAKCLSERFPRVNVLCCGADDIAGRIGDGPPVKAVVSSLPFRSLPENISRLIMSELERVLAPGGLYIQFTYALIGEMPFVPAHFRKLRSKIVLRNVPPAKVEVFRKPKRREAA